MNLIKRFAQTTQSFLKRLAISRDADPKMFRHFKEATWHHRGFVFLAQ
jgi:hypothetical protein